MKEITHIPVNLIQMSWKPNSHVPMHCGLVLGLSCVKGLIFSQSKTAYSSHIVINFTICGTFTIFYTDWMRERAKFVYELNLLKKIKHISYYYWYWGWILFFVKMENNLWCVFKIHTSVILIADVVIILWIYYL